MAAYHDHPDVCLASYSMLVGLSLESSTAKILKNLKVCETSQTSGSQVSAVALLLLTPTPPPSSTDVSTGLLLAD
ncbi:hypothetical protein RRG08_053623 [Elysia crispata]|uniref:Uncharacterized protein n=1 Tax=Elysia crispata TaxID=231223 RepID=A0AAE0Y1B9_9GAST|nr:hypothetical protein RRG08_053623 [Elysia crispata]